jgi:hypothetical protein
VELHHALAVKIDRSEADLRLSPPFSMAVVCAGLITMDENGVVRVLHYTTQKYFEQA